MSFNNLVAVCIFLIPFAYSPGPGVMFFAVNTARLGFKKILPAIMGYHLGIITFTFCYGIVAVTYACYKFYLDNWRDED